MKIYHFLMRVLDKNDLGIYAVDVIFHYRENDFFSRSYTQITV